jgi:hypothetical protein
LSRSVFQPVGNLARGLSLASLHSYFAGTPSRSIALSNEAFALLLNHLRRFLFHRDFDREVCEQMDAYRELVREQLDKVRATIRSIDENHRMSPPDRGTLAQPTTRTWLLRVI